jgi:hypothetical protein
MREHPWLIAALVLFAGAANAQTLFNNSGNDDPRSRSTAAGSNGQCWIATDEPYYDRGTGYWGNCPNAATAANAQATTGPIARKAVHKRMKPTSNEMEQQ